MGLGAEGSGRAGAVIPGRDGEVCVRAMAVWLSSEALRAPIGREGLAVSLTETRHSEEEQGRQAEEVCLGTIQGKWLSVWVSAFLLLPGNSLLKCSVAAWTPVPLSCRR